MPEHWIDEALPEQAPSREFVARLREDLAAGWETGELPPSVVILEHPTRRRRGWMLAAGGIAVAAAAAAAIVVVSQDEGANEQLTPATTPTVEQTSTPATAPVPITTAAPEATEASPPPPPPSAVQPANDLGALVAHHWVQVAVDEPFPASTSVELDFASDGTVRSVGPCDGWTATVVVEAGAMRETSGSEPRCPGIPADLFDVPVAVELDEGGARVTLGGGSQFVAVDTLAPMTAGELTGSWQPATGERLTFAPDGSFGIGSCDPIGSWSFEGGALTASSGYDALQSAACAGGVYYPGARPFTESLVNGDADVSVRRDGDLVLGGRAGGLVWLRPAPADEPALDLDRGTLFGFLPSADVDSEFVVDQLSRRLGPVRQDTGWITIPGIDDPDGEDCYGGLPARVVQFDDTAVGFLDLDGQQRLWSWGIGDGAQSVLDRARLSDPQRVAGDGRTIETADGFGIDSTLDELRAAGFTFSLVGGDGVPVTNDNLATQAYLERSGVTLVLDQGTTVVGVFMENPGFC